MRRRKATVELFEEIRREYEFGVGTIPRVARAFVVHHTSPRSPGTGWGGSVTEVAVDRLRRTR